MIRIQLIVFALAFLIFTFVVIFLGLPQGAEPAG